MDEVQLAALLDRLSTTACVVTSAAGGLVDGCLVSFIVPCSMEPRRLLVLTSQGNLTSQLVEQSGALAVHPVARGQEGWLQRFGRRSGRETNKFAGLAWVPGTTGAPLLADALGYVEGRVLDSMNCGDHTARLVEPVAAVLRDPSAAPLTTFELFARDLIPLSTSLEAPWSGHADS